MQTVRGWRLYGRNLTVLAIIGGSSLRISLMYVLSLPSNSCNTHYTYHVVVKILPAKFITHALAIAPAEIESSSAVLCYNTLIWFDYAKPNDCQCLVYFRRTVCICQNDTFIQFWLTKHFMVKRVSTEVKKNSRCFAYHDGRIKPIKTKTQYC